MSTRRHALQGIPLPSRLLLALPSALPHSWDCPFSHGSADSRPRCFSGTVLAKLQVQSRSSLVPDLLWELWSKPRPCSPLGVRPQSPLLLVWDAPQHGSTGMHSDVPQPRC